MFVMEAVIYCMPGKYKRERRNEGVELTKI
jgi:hypothetical protein